MYRAATQRGEFNTVYRLVDDERFQFDLKINT